MRVRALKASLRRFALVTASAMILTALAGAVFAVVASSGLRSSITSAYFIVGAVLVVGSGLAGGGGRGRRAQVYRTGGVGSAQMPFGWLLVGLCLVGLGVLTVVA